MKLKDALLCIDCDEVFRADLLPCNTRCPSCGSQVTVPMSVWVPASAAYDNPRPRATGPAGIAAAERRMELVHPAPIAA